MPFERPACAAGADGVGVSKMPNAVRAVGPGLAPALARRAPGRFEGPSHRRWPRPCAVKVRNTTVRPGPGAETRRCFRKGGVGVQGGLRLRTSRSLSVPLSSGGLWEGVRGMRWTAGGGTWCLRKGAGGNYRRSRCAVAELYGRRITVCPCLPPSPTASSSVNGYWPRRPGTFARAHPRRAERRAAVAGLFPPHGPTPLRRCTTATPAAWAPATAFWFDRDGPRRGAAFVTRKIARGVARLRNGRGKALRLGNRNVLRDWEHSKDHVEVSCGAFRPSGAGLL